MRKELLMYGRGRHAFLDGLTFQKLINTKLSVCPRYPRNAFLASPITGLSHPVQPLRSGHAEGFQPRLAEVSVSDFWRD